MWDKEYENNEILPYFVFEICRVSNILENGRRDVKGKSSRTVRNQKNVTK